MGLFGSSARIRDKSLMNPEQYQPMFSPQIPESRPMDERIPGIPDFGSAMQVPQMRQGGGFRAKASDFIGNTLDGLIQMRGGKPIYNDGTADALKLLVQKAALEAGQHRSQYAWERDYDIAHPKPVNNDTTADYAFRVQTLGKPAADEWLRSQGDPVVTVNLPGDRIYSGPRSGLGAALGGGGQLPTKPVGRLTPIQGGQGAPGNPFDSIIQQESGGRAGAIGPQTPYGRAQGLSQMLPATAEAQARKLGVAWRPELMTGTSPEAAQYQRQLGESYFNEGLQQTGNLRDAARYYHGGPNRRMWGPKTNHYADAVLARIGG